MEAAVASWHRQMCDEGLMQDDPNAMERYSRRHTSGDKAVRFVDTNHAERVAEKLATHGGIQM